MPATTIPAKPAPVRPAPLRPSAPTLPASSLAPPAALVQPAQPNTAKLNELYGLLKDWARLEPNRMAAAAFVSDVMKGARAGWRVEASYMGFPPHDPRIEELGFQLLTHCPAGDPADLHPVPLSRAPTQQAGLFNDLESVPRWLLMGISRALPATDAVSVATITTHLHAELTQEIARRSDLAPMFAVWQWNVSGALVRGSPMEDAKARVAFGQIDLESGVDEAVRVACFGGYLLKAYVAMHRGDPLKASEYADLAAFRLAQLSPEGRQDPEVCAIKAQAHLLKTGTASGMPKAHAADTLTPALAARAANDQAAYDQALRMLTLIGTPRQHAQLALLHALKGDHREAIAAMKLAVSWHTGDETIDVGFVLNSPFWAQARIDLFWLHELRQRAKSCLPLPFEFSPT